MGRSGGDDRPVAGHAHVSVVGRLTPEGDGRFVLDYGDGQITVLGDQFAEIGTGSIIAVSGRLKHKQWRTEGGSERQIHLIEATEVALLYDARRERMVL